MATIVEKSIEAMFNLVYSLVDWHIRAANR